MSSTIWNKYKILEEIDKKSNIKTYLVRMKPIMKEISYKNNNEYNIIKRRLRRIKNKIKIYDIIEENNKIYIVIDNNNDILSEIDKLIIKDEIEMEKEDIMKEQENPITQNELLKLFKMEKSMCKIYEKIDDKINKGTGFLCEIYNCPIRYGLFTSYQVLNENNTKIGKIMNIEYNNVKKKIEIDKKRRVYTNKVLDYTCIELYESDDIKDYFKIDPILFENKNSINNSDIFILQYPKDNELCFSYGKILSLKENYIIHNASTKEDGSLGSPIIRRSNNDNYIIGLHNGEIKNQKNINNSYNIGTIFDSILNDINSINNLNEINCIYKIKDNENEISLLHDYNNENELFNEYKKLYLEAKEINKKIFEKNIDLYINDKKINFNYTYKINKNNNIKEIKVKFKFNKKLTNMSWMFSQCSSLNSIDLSSFNTSNVTKMIRIFEKCSSLNSINLSSFNTSNVTNMGGMFSDCSSLDSINLSYFNTSNVIDMSVMFHNCSSLKSINLSSFNTSKVTNMSAMFHNCSSSKSIDLSSFNTSNVKYMGYMFDNCSSLKSIDLSSFNTSNATTMSFMFFDCNSLKKKNIIFNKKDNKLLEEINKLYN